MCVRASFATSLVNRNSFGRLRLHDTKFCRSLKKWLVAYRASKIMDVPLNKYQTMPAKSWRLNSNSNGWLQRSKRKETFSDQIRNQLYFMMCISSFFLDSAAEEIIPVAVRPLSRLRAVNVEQVDWREIFRHLATTLKQATVLRTLLEGPNTIWSLCYKRWNRLSIERPQKTWTRAWHRYIVKKSAAGISMFIAFLGWAWNSLLETESSLNSHNFNSVHFQYANCSFYGLGISLGLR